MNVIAANHHTARTGEKYWQSVDTVTPTITPNISKTAVPGLNDKHRPYTWEAKLEEKLTHGRLMRRDDWKDWEQSEFLQLDQYEIQDMFSDPTMLPPNETFNVLPMIWNYLIKKLRYEKGTLCCKWISTDERIHYPGEHICCMCRATWCAYFLGHGCTNKPKRVWC